jgi:hypothetical protein
VTGSHFWLILTTAVACVATARSAPEAPMHPMDNHNAHGFSIGPLVALDGGDGEAVTASGRLIATLGASHATWWVGAAPRTAALPNIPVRGARYSRDGATLLAGTGSIDLKHGVFTAHPAFAGLVERGRPGSGSMAIQATSWSPDGTHAAALLSWTGPQPPDDGAPATRVVILDLARHAAPVTLRADGASGVRIVGDRVVVTAEVVRVFSLAGAEVAALPAGHGAPNGISGGDGGGPMFLMDADWSIRVVDPASWAVRATWAGPFLDAVAVPGGLVAIDLDGRLHAGCLGTGGLTEVGTADTGVRAAQLAATGDGRLVISGAGAVPVHTVTFHLRCGSGS